MLTFDEKKVVGKVSVKLEVTEADIECIIVNGFEMSIGYWAGVDTDNEDMKACPEGEPLSQWATKLILEGKEVKLYDKESGELDEGEDDSNWTLTLKKLLKGIQLNAKERAHDFNIENGDAETYDSIIQYALFGKLEFS